MRGDASIIETLNEILTGELTAINPYFVHTKMRENWGYLRLAKRARSESIDEMRHAEALIERILFLEGVPNVQRLGTVRVGESPKQQLEIDLATELEAVDRLNRAIALCREKADNGTRERLERMLLSEESAVDWLEAQLHVIGEIGEVAYLAEQMGE